MVRVFPCGLVSVESSVANPGNNNGVGMAKESRDTTTACSHSTARAQSLALHGQSALAEARLRRLVVLARERGNEEAEQASYIEPFVLAVSPILLPSVFLSTSA